MIQPIVEPPLDLEARVHEYTSHLRNVAEWFNDYALAERLGVKIDAEGAIGAVEGTKTSLSRIAPFLVREDDTGVLHREQLVTAIDAIMKIIENPDQAGLILGALQSGKTTTGLALQLVGPLYYCLTGKRLYPFYLLTSQTSHQAQTTYELQLFLQYYGDLAFSLDDENPNPRVGARESDLDQLFVMSPTLNMYRDNVLRVSRNTFTSSKVEDFVWRRAWGENVVKIAAYIETIARSGAIPLMIIDEPQFGASDRIVVEPSGELRQIPCVFNRIFDEISARLDIAKGEHVFIALSATPFEIHDLTKIWTIRQRIGAEYSGFDFFAGAPIDGTNPERQPHVTDFIAFGEELGVPFLARVDLLSYHSLERFMDRKKKLDYQGTWEQYRADVLAAMKKMLLALKAKNEGANFGVCLRAVNNNVKVEDIIRDLDLGDAYDVVSYFGGGASGKSVKQVLATASRTRPYLIAVTNRARMGDAFPSNVKYFIEFTEKFTDLNSMMQGLIGRACGYGKDSTIVLSSRNALTMRTVAAALGGYIMDPSRHTVVVGNKRRGRPTVIVPIWRDHDNTVLEAVFAALDREIVQPVTIGGRGSLQAKRGGGRRTGPILRIFDEADAFSYIESEEARGKYYPDYPRFQIARATDRVQNPARLGTFLRYFLDKEGKCRYALREWKGESAHSGLRARGRSGGDDDRARDEQHDFLEPQILVEKFDPNSGKVIADYGEEDAPRAPGNWRAVAIVMPLLHPVQEFVAGTAAYPVAISPYDAYMEPAEKRARDNEVRERAERADAIRQGRAS